MLLDDAYGIVATLAPWQQTNLISQMLILDIEVKLEIPGFSYIPLMCVMGLETSLEKAT